MRKKRLLWNTISSLGNQVITIICGFILPRVILKAYGSDVNGLVSSITQFLGIIAFLEFGVGAVVQSALYKPLAEKDDCKISAIVSSSNKFFRKIAIIMFIYIIVLCAFYPMLISSYDAVSTIILIIAMSISSFAQYYFGITNRLLLTADQRGYVVYLLQAVTVVTNTVVCSFLIYLGASIQIVKIVTSIIYLARPIGQYIYIRKKYKIDKHIEYLEEPIQQKWNGLAQHVAAVVLDNTDTIVLTCLSTLENVSIYSVYYLVVHGVKQLFLSMTRGIQAMLGEMWAKRELKELHATFSWTEWVIHTSVVLIFGATLMLIVPFVRVYTYGINDANYVAPLFATLLTLAHACHCLRLPYNIMVLVAGHYRQTQQVYIVAAIINILVSIMTVKNFGLIGVAIGTLVAMIFQSIWLALYVSKKLIDWPIINSLKQLIVDIVTVVICSAVSGGFALLKLNYASWVLLSFKTLIVWIAIILIINKIFYPEKIDKVLFFIRKKRE